MNNKKLGTSFEREVCRYFQDRGYWVHFITPDMRGAQPFDIIAAKNGEAVAVECKTLTDRNNWFPLSRLEENQQMAFRKWYECGNLFAFVAVKWRGKIYFINYPTLRLNGKVDMREQEAIG